MFTAFQHHRTRFWSHVITVLVVLTCLRVWMGEAPALSTAQAQIPDAGMQRRLLIEEVRRTNRLLDEIKQILTSHTLNVRLQGADNQAHLPAEGRGKGG